MLDSKEIIDFFKLENSHAKKELGQNFLINKKVCESIVSLLPIDKEKDKVLEIGPGLGALSDILINKSNDLTLVEYDAKFVNFLSLSYEQKNNVKIVKNNILKVKDEGFNKVIGNLPYYMTTEILQHITFKFESFEFGVFMVQKECIKRILSLSGKDYSAFNVFLNYAFDIKCAFDVGKNNFFPIPGVDSTVFALKKKENIDIIFAKKIFKVATALFLNRRKTILNNLNSFIKNKELSLELLNKANLKDTLRAEQLTVEDYIKLTNILIENNLIK